MRVSRSACSGSDFADGGQLAAPRHRTFKPLEPLSSSAIGAGLFSLSFGVQCACQRFGQTANIGRDFSEGPLSGLFEMTYESASHNDAVSHFTELPGVLGLADAEADTDGQIGLRPQPAKLAREALRQAIALAGDAGNADIVEKASRGPGDARGPLARRGRRH